MTKMEPLVRNVSDTALWVAVYRAYESERKDALFHDPFAKKLAGARGIEIAGSTKFLKKLAWPFIARTWLFDKLIMESIASGSDVVVNLASGLDTRPYRLTVQPGLKWIEVDLPDLINYKSDILKKEQPRCQLERIALDLSDQSKRRELFQKLNALGDNILILTEGLLIYLEKEEVKAFASDLAAFSNNKRWISDLASPPLLRMMQKQVGSMLDSAGAPLKFAPEEGVRFFESHGWGFKEVHSMFKTAGKLGRLTWPLKLLSLLPEKEKDRNKRHWSGVCLFEKNINN